MRRRILVVEDNFEQLKRYRNLVSETMDCSVASTLEEAQVAMNCDPVDIVLTDIHLTESIDQKSYEGFEVIKYAKSNHPQILILAMSADPKIDTYEAAHRLGAHHWVKKPILDLHELKIAIDTAERTRQFSKLLKSRNYTARLPESIARLCEDGLVIDDKARKLVSGIAKSRALPCVVYGETGTGKEEIAKLIHKKRCTVEGEIPFVAVNCANLNSSMAVSIIFGHRKGAFTGAEQTTNGLIGEADGGILFLDEIHRLSEECQARLLRVLNDGTYERLGDSKTLRSDFQTIAASTKDLDDAVADGEFLMDLRSRLTGVDIHLPPLRERLDDIDLLVPHIFAKEKIEIPNDNMKVLIEKCKSYYWQGNIRQLLNVLKSFHTMCVLNDEPFDPDNLPEYKSMFSPHKKSSLPSPCNTDEVSLKQKLEEYEKQLIASALSKFPKKAKVADYLQISRSNLDVKIAKYGL